MTMSKNDGMEKEDNEKDKQYQKTEENSVLNIHSICTCSDHLFSFSYGYGFDLTFPRIFC